MTPHFHDDSGAAIFGDLDPGPTPEEAAASAVTSAARTEADAEIEIARIEAATAIKLAQLERSSLADEERVELEALRLEVAALRGLAAPDPAPEPEPLPVEVAEPEPAPTDPPPAVEGSAPPEHKPKQQRIGMW